MPKPLKLYYPKEGEIVTLKPLNWLQKHMYLYIRLGRMIVSQAGHKWKADNERRLNYLGQKSQVTQVDYIARSCRLSCDGGFYSWHFTEIDGKRKRGFLMPPILVNYLKEQQEQQQQPSQESS